MERSKNRTLWDLTAGWRLRYGAAIFVLGLSNVFLFGAPLVSMAAIDGVLMAGGEETSTWLHGLTRALRFEATPGRVLGVAALCLVLLTALAAGCQYLRMRWVAIASEGIVRGLRDRLYGHLARLSCRYHDSADTGDLVQRCTSDVETVRVFLTGQVVEIGRAILLFLTVTPILFWRDPRLALVSLALFPLIVGFAVAFFRRIQVLFRLTDEAEGEMTTVLQENLTGIRVVRAFARQEFECEKFAERNAAFRDRNWRLIRLLAAYWSLSDFVCLVQIGLVVLFGAHWLMQGTLTVGTYFAFLTLEGIVIWPVRHMGRVLADTGKALVALRRLRHILDQPEEDEQDRLASSEPAALQGELEFRDVHFAYGEGQEALRGLSFQLRAGETLALLGPPGSGKSTVIHLLLRLYDYGGGSIRLDGRELSGLSRAFVRSNVGVVLQEPFLFSRSLRDNLQLGRADASEEELVAAARDACIHESIEGFDEGYDTLVGERGVTLSGGQRQRVALARALLERPSILVLDDALSAVDTRTEAHILAALRRRRGRRTTIVIAHRLSSVEHADRILVLDGGRVVQVGTHDELIGRDGPYRRLWRIQGALEDAIDDDLEAIGERKERA